MKRKIIVILLLILTPISINASTNTCQRDIDNLNIPDKIKYKESMNDSILTTPCVDATEKVYDFADLFTQEEETTIYEKVTSFINNTNLDLAILTLNNNPKETTKEIADDFFDYNDFKEDGLAIVIDMENREFYISTSGKAILYYDDYRIESMLDNAYYLTDSLYKDAITSTISDSEYYYNQGIINADYEITKDGVVVRKTPWITLIIISLIPTIIITLQLALRNKKIKLATTADEYLEGNKINITKREDQFVNSHTSSIYIPPSESSGGSSGRSGGSFHSGSSGRSHGGGGRKF